MAADQRSASDTARESRGGLIEELVEIQQVAVREGRALAWAGNRALLSWRDDRSSVFGPMEVWATAVDCDWILRSTDVTRLPSAPDLRAVPPGAPWTDPDRPMLDSNTYFYQLQGRGNVLSAVRNGTELELWY